MNKKHIWLWVLLFPIIALECYFIYYISSKMSINILTPLFRYLSTIPLCLIAFIRNWNTKLILAYSILFAEFIYLLFVFILQKPLV